MNRGICYLCVSHTLIKFFATLIVRRIITYLSSYGNVKVHGTKMACKNIIPLSFDMEDYYCNKIKTVIWIRLWGWGRRRDRLLKMKNNKKRKID